MRKSKLLFPKYRTIAINTAESCRFGSESDISVVLIDVRFTPKKRTYRVVMIA
jgi:hypothetical protein